MGRDPRGYIGLGIVLRSEDSVLGAEERTNIGTSGGKAEERGMEGDS